MCIFRVSRVWVLPTFRVLPSHPPYMVGSTHQISVYIYSSLFTIHGISKMIIIKKWLYSTFWLLKSGPRQSITKESNGTSALRRILGIRWYDKVSNAVVNERTKLPDSYCWQTSFIIWSHLSPIGEHTCFAGTTTVSNEFNKKLVGWVAS